MISAFVDLLTPMLIFHATIPLLTVFKIDIFRIEKNKR